MMSLPGRGLVLNTSVCLRKCLHRPNNTLHRTLHTTPVHCKKSDFPSATSRKAKNIDFVRRWNKENLELFGPKLKISKKTLQKRAAAAEIEIESDENPMPAGVETVTVDTSTEQKDEVPTKRKTAAKTTKKTKTSQPAPVKRNISELDAVLRFPLFRPDADTLAQHSVSAASLMTSELSVLHGLQPPRVTRVLDQTKSEQSQFVLNRWIQQQIALLGKEEFGKAQKKRMQSASTLHGCLEQYLMGTPEHLLNLDEQIMPFWTSLQGVLQSVDEVFGVEVKLEHEQLMYKGTADCIARYKGELCVVDWKTSSKPRPALGDLYDYPIQVAAYMGALHFNRLDSLSDKDDKVDSLLIVVGYEDGSPAHAHYIPRRQVLRYWGEWTRRLHQYWTTTLSKQSAGTS